MKKYETLAEAHINGASNHRVITHGNGHSYVQVHGDLYGHLATVQRVANVEGWTPYTDAHGVLHIPTYAYDRVVVAGLGCMAPVEIA